MWVALLLQQGRRALAWAVIMGMVVAFGVTSAVAGDLVRLVRYKLSAGDLASGEAAVEEYKKATGMDPEYLDAVGWLARGAEMLRKPEVAAVYVALLRREIPVEKPELTTPLGAAIEVEAKLRAARDGRGAALRFLEMEFARAKDVALRSRIRKNINLFSLEGQLAPTINAADRVGTRDVSLKELIGKPVLLFFFNPGCGDCRAQAGTLARIDQKYRSQGLTMIAPTRYYGFGAEGKSVLPAEEKALIEKNWAEVFKGLEGVVVPIDTETMVAYGVSATPTYVLIDRKGIVRLYTPTRLAESVLERRIQEVLAEAP